MMTRGMIHHFEINVSNLQKSSEFYGWFLGELGYELYQSWETGQSFLLGNTYLVLVQTKPHLVEAPYERYGTGLNHLAFHAESRQDVDEMTNKLLAKGFEILYPDQHPYAGGANYYALYFEDPDGIKLELVAPN